MAHEPELTLVEMQKRVDDWVKQPGSLALLEETRLKARAASEKVLNDARVDYNMLRQPITI